MGLTFRESFLSWKRKPSSLNSNLVWIQKVPNLNRRIANDALNEFMKNLQFRTVKVLKNFPHVALVALTMKMVTNRGVKL